MRLIILVLLLVSVLAVEARTSTPVSDLCEYDYPLVVVFVAADGGVARPDIHEIGALKGITRPRARGVYRGQLIIRDFALEQTFIDVFQQGKRWALACDNGVNAVVRSPYLDACLLAGEC